MIEVDDLPERLRQALGVVPEPAAMRGLAMDIAAPLEDNVKRLEREYLLRLLAECNGVKTHMAERAQISPQTVYNKLAEFREWLDAATSEPHLAEIERLKGLAGAFWETIVD